MVKFSNYALWFDLKKGNDHKIKDGFKDIYDNLIEMYEIVPKTKFNFEDMFLKIGNDFYLIRVPAGWSPGDISGMFKHKYLDKDEQIMAVLISRDFYLPPHGLSSSIEDKLGDWSSFPDKYELIFKNET